MSMVYPTELEFSHFCSLRLENLISANTEGTTYFKNMNLSFAKYSIVYCAGPYTSIYGWTNGAHYGEGQTNISPHTL